MEPLYKSSPPPCLVLGLLEIGAGFAGTAGIPTACAVWLAQHLIPGPFTNAIFSANTVFPAIAVYTAHHCLTLFCVVCATFR